MADAYIRGGGGVQVNARRVVAALVALGLAAMVGVIAQLTVSAAHQNDQLTRLQRHGVPVELTVSRCLAISSGIGMGVEYWQCRGTYTFAGRAYEEVIGGSRTRLEPGQTLTVVADPGRPSVVWTAAALARKHPSRTAYITPAVLAGVVVAVAGGWAVLRSRRRRPRSVGQGLGVGLPQPDGHVDEQLVGDSRDLVQHGQELPLPDH